MFKIFVQYHIKRFKRYFQTNSFAKGVTAGMFMIILAGLAVGIFFFMKAGFNFVRSDEFLRTALPLYIYEMFLLIMMYLIIASSLITGLFSLFKSDKEALIMGSPRFDTLPVYIYANMVLASLWPLIVLAIPTLAAMQTVFSIGFWGMTLSFIAALLLLAFSVLASLVILFALAALAGFINKYFKAHARQFGIGFMAIVVAVFFLSISAVAWQQTATADILELFDAENPETKVAGVDQIKQRFRIFPSHLAAVTFFEAQEHNLANTYLPVFRLTLLFLIAILLFRELQKKYLPLWQTFQEGSFEAGTQAKSNRVGGGKIFPRFFKNAIGAIFEKEALMMARNTRDVMWAGFLLFIWLAQTGLNLFLRNNIEKYDVATSNIPAVIQAMQIVIIIYFASAFVLRFAFPSFSSERRSAWIVAGAPISLNHLFYAKFIFYAVVFTFIGFLMGFLNAIILGTSFSSIALFLGFVTIAVITVVATGISLGAIFPNFETDDPQVLSTSLPGLTFIFGSILYGAFGTATLYFYFTSGSIIAIFLFLAASILTSGLFLHVAPRALKQVEFV